MAGSNHPADSRHVLGRSPFPQIASGLVLGLAGSLALSRLLRAWLFGAAPTDPQTFAG